MKYYFTEKKGKKEGPFTYDDLKDKKISDEYNVWSEGMDSWVNAGDCAELSQLIIKKPPLTEKELKARSLYLELKNNSIYLLIVHLFTTIAIFIINGGFLEGEDLVLVLRNSANPIFFIDENQTIIFILFASTILALPFTMVFGLLVYKKLLFDKCKRKKSATALAVVGTIILILLTVIYKFYYEGIISGIFN